jgi:hypothetical protein
LRVWSASSFSASSRSERLARSARLRLAQYLGWTEILRRDIQFLDFGEPKETRAVAKLQATIAHKFATDTLPKAFMLWQDEQRAIGELMIVREHGVVDCLGYAGFREREKSAWPWVERLERELRSGDARSSERLLEIQNLLCDLVEMLDRDKVFDRSRLLRASAHSRGEPRPAGA